MSLLGNVSITEDTAIKYNKDGSIAKKRGPKPKSN